MYEKPQYLTPTGYKRMSRSPVSAPPAQTARNAVARPQPLSIKSAMRKGAGISDEAAALIAGALKVMLHT